MQLIETSEAAERIDAHEKTEALGVIAAKEERRGKAKQTAPRVKSAPIVAAPAREKKPIVAPIATELSAADRAMMRKQKEETHQYGKRAQINLQWLLLAKQLRQSMANTVLAESAVDLSKWHAH